MIVIGATWTIMYNADLLLGALAATVGRIRAPRAGAADVDRLPAAEPLPHRRDAGDVHARRLHARRRRDDVGLVHERLQRRQRIRRRLRRSRHDLAGTADREHAGGGRPNAGSRRAATSASSRASRRCPSRRASSESAPRRSPTSSTAPTTPSSRTRPTGSPPARAATARVRRSGERCATHRNLAVVDQFVVPRQANWNFGLVRRSSGSRGFYLEDKTFDPVKVSVRDPQTGKRRDADRDRRPLRQRAAVHGAGSGRRSARSRLSSATACSRRSTSSRCGRESTRRRPRRSSSPPSCANGMQADSLEELLARHRRRERDVRTG